MTQPGIVARLFNALRRKPPGAPPPVMQRSTVAAPRRQTPPPMHPLVQPVDGSAKSEPIVVVTMRPVSSIEVAVQPRHVTAAAEAFIDSVKQLPLFSGTAMQLMKSFGDENLALDDLARMIATDAGLVAQLLRIVNSPFYGLPKQCATVTDAISVLGFAQVRRIVSAAVTQRPLSNYLVDARAVQAFARHQLLSASMSRHLAVKKGLDGEIAYMAGLMHEVGRLAIVARHPHLTAFLLNVDADDGHLVREQETAHFGFDHAEAGGALLARWGLPQGIVDATFDHEAVEQPVAPISAVVWRANLLSHTMLLEPDEQAVQSPWMMAVDLSVAERRRILDEVATLSGGQG